MLLNISEILHNEQRKTWFYVPGKSNFLLMYYYFPLGKLPFLYAENDYGNNSYLFSI